MREKTCTYVCRCINNLIHLNKNKKTNKKAIKLYMNKKGKRFENFA